MPGATQRQREQQPPSPKRRSGELDALSQSVLKAARPPLEHSSGKRHVVRLPRHANPIAAAMLRTLGGPEITTGRPARPGASTMGTIGYQLPAL